MSWMDSWSRPSKGEATPPPFYLTQGDNARYCATCGRIIGARRLAGSKSSTAEVKYCSDKCKHRKPKSTSDSIDRRIEAALRSLLLGEMATGIGMGEAAKSKTKPKKGDPRIIVQISDIQTAVFGDTKDPEKVYGRQKNRAKRGVPDAPEWRSVDMENISEDHAQASADQEEDDAGEIVDFEQIDADADMVSRHIRPAQSQSLVNGSVGGEKGWAERTEETAEMQQKRLEGQKRAEDLELVKNAARRAVVFGVLVDSPDDTRTKQTKHADTSVNADAEANAKTRRKCEALMNGKVVEPSFAKGDWSIRWRED